MKINLIKGDKINSDADYRDALPVNMYAVKRNILGGNGYMTTYPGISSFGTGLGKDRGGIYNERAGTHYRISGTELISVDSDGTAHDLGTVSGIDQASMPYSFNTQAIIANGGMYLYDSTNGFRQVTDANIGTPIDGMWIDGYYFLTDGEYLYHTELNDESAINTLSYATAEFMPDPCLGVAKSQDNKAVVFGRYTIEYFVDVATENFAFKRVESRAQKIGIVATHAKVEVEGDWYIVGGRKNESISVHKITLGDSAKLATREIDQILDQYAETDLTDIRVESRSEKNTVFIIIHLPNETLLFNMSIAESFGIEYAWSIIKTGDQPHRAINGIFDPRNGKWIYGDIYNSNLGSLSNTTFSQYDEQQELIIFCPFVNLETKSVDQIEIETIPGRTTLEDSKIAVSMTYDGETYTKEWWMKYGDPTEYTRRFILRRLGYASDWVGFKFRGVSKSKMSFANFDLEAS